MIETQPKISTPDLALVIVYYSFVFCDVDVIRHQQNRHHRLPILKKQHFR